MTNASNGVAPHARGFRLKATQAQARKAFDPQLGDLGSWVTLPDGTTGQVWSIARGGKRPEVIVADGTSYRRHLVSDLVDLVSTDVALVAS